MIYDELNIARPLLKRVLAGNDLTLLSADERQALERVAGIAAPSDGENAQPLWLWIRDGVWDAPSVARNAFFATADSKLDTLMTTSGVAISPTPTIVGRLLTPVSLGALKHGVLSTLRTGSDILVCRAAALIAAFAGFDDAVPHLKRLLIKESGPTMRDLIHGDVRLALAMLGIEAPAPSVSTVDDEVASARLVYLERWGNPSSLNDIVAALGEDGWTLERIRRYPSLLRQFGALGGDLAAAVGQIAARGEMAWMGQDDAQTAQSLALAIADAGNASVVSSLRHLLEATSAPRKLLGHLYIELAHLRCTATLEPLRERIAYLRTCTVHDREMEYEYLKALWAAGVLDPDGPAWLEAIHLDDPDDVFAIVAGLLLAIARDDAKALLSATAEGEEGEVVRMVAKQARLVIEGDAFSCIRLLPGSRHMELSDYLNLLQRAASLGRRNARPYADLLDLLRDPDRDDLAIDASTLDPLAILRWMHLMLENGAGHRALLTRARFLPPALAAAVLEGMVARIRKLPCERETALLLDLAFVELGCVPEVEHRVGAETLAMLRMCAAHHPAGVPLPELERSVARGMLGTADRDLQCRLAELLQGDAVFDAIASSLAYRDVLGDSSSFLGRTDALDAVLRTVGVTDRLSAVLHNPSAVPAHERAAAAATLLASPSARLRALAVHLLFGECEPASDLVALRDVYLCDPSDAVQIALIERIGNDFFRPDEIRRVLSNAVMHYPGSKDVWSGLRSTRAREAAAAAMGRLRQHEFLDLLFPLLSDEEASVASEARGALRGVVDAMPSIVVLSIAKPQELAEHYGLAPPDFLALMSDPRVEGLRLTLQAIEQRADPAHVAAHFGRRLVLAPIKIWPPPAPSGGLLSQLDFERLALHLRVMLVDDASGSIVVEVGSEPTGEVLSAIFETGDTALLQVVWG